MSRHLRGYAVRSDGAGPIRFIASTADVARDGIVIDAGAWDLANYRANAVVLWAHSYLGSPPPIGKATRIESVGGNLVADVEFDQNDPFARQIESKYRNGFLNAVSVGWDTKAISPASGPGGAPRVTKAELLEISCVPVPSDPGALAVARSRYHALRPAGTDTAAIAALSEADKRRFLEAMSRRLAETELRLALGRMLR